jgi:hypothetical protein
MVLELAIIPSGVASLFGLLWTFQLIHHSPQLPADIWLVANVGEEGWEI